MFHPPPFRPSLPGKRTRNEVVNRLRGVRFRLEGDEVGDLRHQGESGVTVEFGAEPILYSMWVFHHHSLLQDWCGDRLHKYSSGVIAQMVVGFAFVFSDIGCESSTGHNYFVYLRGFKYNP
jgi:hypothetical protein